MAVHELRLETIEKHQEGRIAEAYNRALQQLTRDCFDRPGEQKPRTLDLRCQLVPVLDADGYCYTVKYDFQVINKSPAAKSKVFEAQVRGGNKLAFNDLSDENADQRTLDENGGFAEE